MAGSEGRPQPVARLDVSWHGRALCAKIPDWHTSSHHEQAEACGWCPVLDECREYALASPAPLHRSEGGVVYAGMNAAELRRAHRARVEAAA